MRRSRGTLIFWRERPAPRGGWTLIELLVAMAVMIATASFVAQTLTSARGHWDKIATRQSAWFEADAALRQLSLLPYDALTADHPIVAQLQQAVAERMPGAELQVIISASEATPADSEGGTEVTTGAAGKLLTTNIVWNNPGESLPQTVSLQSWVSPATNASFAANAPPADMASEPAMEAAPAEAAAERESDSVEEDRP